MASSLSASALGLMLQSVAAYDSDDESFHGNGHHNTWHDFSEWLRNTAYNLGHSSAYVHERLTRRNAKTVALLMTIGYWPTDKITMKQEETILGEITKWSHLINPDIPHAGQVFASVGEYVRWSATIEATLLHSLDNKLVLAA